MKAWKSQIIEGKIERHELRDLVEKTVHIPKGARFAVFVAWDHGGVQHKLDFDAIHFEVLLQDATDAQKQG